MLNLVAGIKFPYEKIDGPAMRMMQLQSPVNFHLPAHALRTPYTQLRVTCGLYCEIL
jgi:hypothetical protein